MTPSARQSDPVQAGPQPIMNPLGRGFTNDNQQAPNMGGMVNGPMKPAPVAMTTQPYQMPSANPMVRGGGADPSGMGGGGMFGPNTMGAAGMNGISGMGSAIANAMAPLQNQMPSANPLARGGANTGSVTGPPGAMGGSTNPPQSALNTNGLTPQQIGMGMGYDPQGRLTFQNSGPVPLSGVTAGMLGLTQNANGQYTNSQGGVAGTVQGGAGVPGGDPPSFGPIQSSGSMMTKPLQLSPNQTMNGGAPPQLAQNSGMTAPAAMDTSGSMLPAGQSGQPGGTGVNANGQISGVPQAPLGQVQTGVNTSNVPGLPGGDALSAQMTAAQQAAYQQATGYLDPQFANQENSLRNQLVNQGIPQNSEAWNKAMDDFNRQKTFAYQQAQNSAVQQGNQAQAQTFGEGLAANQNQFGQNVTAGNFANSAQSQQVQQIMQALGFNEGVNQNNFNNSMGMRQQDLNELLQQQQNPLQMFQALSGGNGVTSPQFSQTPGATVGGTDIASIIAQALGQQNSVYNTQVGATNSANSGTASIAAAIIAGLLSDRRLKKNVRMIGMHEVGVPLYSFDYLWDKPGIGVMADELENVLPDAVFTTPSGYKAVDYAKLSKVA